MNSEIYRTLMVDVIEQLNSLNKLLQRRKRNCHAVLRQHTLLVQLKAHVVGDTAGKGLIFSYLRNVSVNDVRQYKHKIVGLLLLLFITTHLFTVGENRGSYKMKVNSYLLQSKVVNKNHINLI